MMRHAQREAYKAFIRSQQGKGWQPRTTRYDDAVWAKRDSSVESPI